MNDILISIAKLLPYSADPDPVDIARWLDDGGPDYDPEAERARRAARKLARLNSPN